MTGLASLQDDLEPLRAWFEQERALARMIAIQSPT